ncbi:MAG: ABC transporter permease [Ruminococcaceae bacterium]|nr:ABC transporter permease [Oscillospiraceae bacterium]
MFARHGIRSAARMPGRTALTFLLTLLVAAMLGTSLGLTWTVRRALTDCEDRYTTLGVLEYVTGEDETAPAEIAAKAAALTQVALPEGALRREPTRVAQGCFTEDQDGINFNDARLGAVLVVRIRTAAKFVRFTSLEQVEDGTVLIQEEPEGAGETDEEEIPGGSGYGYGYWEPAEALVNDVLFSCQDMKGKLITLDGLDFGTMRDMEQDGCYLVSGTWQEVWSTSKRLEVSRYLPPLHIDSTGDINGPGSEPFHAAAASWEALLHSVTVRASEHLADYLPFQQQTIHLESGRMFTPEEESDGANVCMISRSLADLTGWQSGDTVRLALATRPATQVMDSYLYADGFDKEADYTITGVFSSNDQWNRTVFIPVPQDVDMTVNCCDTVLGQLRLDNEGARAFLAAAEPLLPDGVQLRIYDQGYEAVARPLRTMLHTVELVALACLLAGAGFLLLTAWLYVARQHRAGDLMYRLGASRRDVAVYFLSGLAAIAVPAAVLGAVLSAAVTERISAAMSGVLQNAVRRNLSFSADKLALLNQQETDLGAGVPPTVCIAIALAMLLVLLALCLHFANGTVPRQRTQRIRTAGRSLARTHALTGGAAKYAWLSGSRGGFRTAVTVLAPVCAAVLLCLLAHATESCRTQLTRLEEESTVRGYFTDINGQRLTGTRGDMRDVFAILDLEETVDGTVLQKLGPYQYNGVYDAQSSSLGGWVIEEPQGELARERAATAELYYPSVFFANRLDGAPQFAYSGAPEVRWLEGYEDVLGAPVSDTGRTWEEMTDEELAADPFSLAEYQITGFRPLRLKLTAVPCVVSTAFLERNKLQLGDEIRITVSDEQFGYDPWRLLIAGSYVKPLGRDNIYLPLYVAMQTGLYDREGPEYEAYFRPVESASPFGRVQWQKSTAVDGAVFSFRCGDLEGLKRHLKELGLSEVRQLTGTRKPFVLEDGAFQASQQTIRQRLWYMERIFPVAAALTEALALVMSFLQVLGRRKEMWIMHCMGTSGTRTFFSIYLEQLVLCLAGGVIGLAACRLLGIWQSTGVRQTALFTALWLLGALIAAAAGVARPDRRDS